MTRLIHVDTDIGGDTDDLCALVMLLGWPDVEVTGVTTSTEVDGVRAGFARYVLQLAGRIPETGARFRVDDLVELEVVEATPRRVRRVRIRPLWSGAPPSG